MPWGEAPLSRDRCNLLFDSDLKLVAVTEMTDGAAPNGLRHLIGNAAEWCGNRYVPGEGDVQPPEDVHPIRGCGFTKPPGPEARLTWRAYESAAGAVDVGFRLLIPIGGEDAAVTTDEVATAQTDRERPTTPTEAPEQKLKRFKSVALGVFNYENSKLSFPISDGNSEGLSWRVKLLPFLEQGELHQQFANEESWDSPTNTSLADRMPAVLGLGIGMSDVCWIRVPEQPNDITDIVDGTIHTLMLIEYPRGVKWTRPDTDLTSEQVVQLVTQLPDGQSLIAVDYSAAVRLLNNSINPDKLRAMITPNGGERLDD